MVITNRYILIMDKRREAFRRALIYFIENGKNITQAKLSSGTGIKQSMISGMKTGKRWGTEESRRAIADFFGRSYEDFLAFGSQLIDAENALALQSLPDPAPNHQTLFEQQHANIMKRIKNREIVIKINAELVELEAIDPGTLKEVFEFIRFKKQKACEDQKKRGHGTRTA